MSKEIFRQLLWTIFQWIIVLSVTTGPMALGVLFLAGAREERSKGKKDTLSPIGYGFLAVGAFMAVLIAGFAWYNALPETIAR